MAGPLDSIDAMPIWQRIMLLIVGAVLIGAGWYFFFWTEAVEGHQTAGVALGKAETTLKGLETRKANFLEEQLAHEAREAEFSEKMEVLPMSSSAVDNLSQTLQQQALSGFTIESWTPEPEERQDYYARLPITVDATGTWAQAADFFRKVSDLKQIVSIENLALVAKRTNDDLGGHPALSLSFEVATYRFLSEEERSSGQNTRGTKRKASKRK